MRVIMAIWWTLAIVWLTMNPLEGQSQSKKIAKVKDWPVEVKGYGLSEEAAKADAIERVREEIIAYLRKKDRMPVVWRPSTTYIEKNLLNGQGHAGPEVPLDEAKELLGEVADNVGPATTWIYSLKQIDLARIGQLDEQAQRSLRAEERFAYGLYFVVAVVVFLGSASVLLSTKEWLANRKQAQPGTFFVAR